MSAISSSQPQHPLIPAKAGTQCFPSGCGASAITVQYLFSTGQNWVLAFARMSGINEGYFLSGSILGRRSALFATMLRGRPDSL